MLQIIGIIMIFIAVLDSGFDMAYNLQSINKELDKSVHNAIARQPYENRNRRTARAAQLAKKFTYHLAYIIYDMLLLITVYVAYRTIFNFTFSVFIWDLVFMIIAIINYRARRKDQINNRKS